MKKICLILILFIPFLGLKAQENMSPKERITQVMQSEEEFLYADQTCATVEQALERAQAILIREVDAYLKQSGGDDEVVKGIVTEQMVTLTVQRGDKYRAFVYINKANLNTSNYNSSVNETTIIEQTAVSEQAAVTKQTAVTESAVASEALASNEVAVQEKVLVQPVEDVPQVQQYEVLRQITTLASRLQVYDYICLLQKEGERIMFFEHPNANEQENMYLVLYKRGGKIDAILTPVDEQGIRHNLVTGQPDTKNNHPATSVNGFIYERQ